MIRGRYAPSPTGRLHLGNLASALVCWLQVRLAGGELLLRMDDLDQARVQPGAVEQILQDLRWLGLDWDGEPVIQSQRAPVYQAAFERLNEQGLVYPCICSRKDIQRAADTPPPGGSETPYPGTCRPADGKTVSADEKPAAWRFVVEDNPVRFHDEVLGDQSANLATAPGDFVVRRKDGISAYQLATVVDDGLLGVTDVVRGADLADSTARQLALFDALGYPRPRFWHVPLINDDQGVKLSKRDGSDSLAQFQALGLEADDVIGELARRLGLWESTEAVSARKLKEALGLDELRQRLQFG